MNEFRFNIVTDILLILLFLGGLYLLLRPFSLRAVEGDFYAVKFVDDAGILYQLSGDNFS